MARFTLVLTATSAETRAFAVYLEASPATSTQTLFALCGEASGPPCDLAHSPFTLNFSSFAVGTALLFRIERLTTDGTVEVLSQGSEVFHLATPEQRVSWPP